MLTAKERMIIGMKLIKDACNQIDMNECIDDECPMSENCKNLIFSPDSWDIEGEKGA